MVFMFVFLFEVEVVGGGHDKNSVTLTCNTETEGNIEWKFHDGSEEVISGDNIQLEGLNLTILDVDERGDIGEYSCWRGQEKLSSVYLLLEATEEDKPGKRITHKHISGVTGNSVFTLLCASLQVYLSIAGPSLMTVTSTVSGLQADTQRFA